MNYGTELLVKILFDILQTKPDAQDSSNTWQIWYVPDSIYTFERYGMLRNSNLLSSKYVKRFHSPPLLIFE